MESSIALTFAEGFLEAFPVNVSEDVMWLPVEVSECQFAEELIAARKQKKTPDDNTQQMARSASHIQLSAHTTTCPHASCASNTKVGVGALLIYCTKVNEQYLLTVVLCSAQYAARTGCS